VIGHVCVVGGGSIGSLFAGHLSRVVQTSLITRRPEHADAIRRDGLRVSGRSDFTARNIDTDTSPRDLFDPDLVIVACKGVDLEDVALGIEGWFPDADVITIQNGLGAEEIISAHGAQSGWSLISGVTFMSGTKHSDTHVEYILDTPTWLGPYGDTPFESVREAAELISSSGLQAEAFDDLRPAQWAKLIFNATVNAVAALTGLPHDVHYAEGALGELVHVLVDEGKAVAAASGVALREDPWEMNVHATKRGAAHYPSMLEDVEAHRPTEIELITGALVREAGKHGVPVPLHTALYALVRGREASYA
jgi:2-dehydropantoate 2-reductase